MRDVLEEPTALAGPVGTDCCNILLKQLLPNTSYCQRSSVTVFQSERVEGLRAEDSMFL
jgi:hypothetical protein